MSSYKMRFHYRILCCHCHFCQKYIMCLFSDIVRCEGAVTLAIFQRNFVGKKVAMCEYTSVVLVNTANARDQLEQERKLLRHYAKLHYARIYIEISPAKFRGVTVNVTASVSSLNMCSFCFSSSIHTTQIYILTSFFNYIV